MAELRTNSIENVFKIFVVRQYVATKRIYVSCPIAIRRGPWAMAHDEPVTFELFYFHRCLKAINFHFQNPVEIEQSRSYVKYVDFSSCSLASATYVYVSHLREPSSYEMSSNNQIF